MDAGILHSDLVAEDNTIAFALYESIRYQLLTGSTAVNEKRFEDSIKHFSSAIKDVQEKILAVLFAHRAQSFERLQQYDLMLADAGLVIKYFPTSAHGYVQAGRALHRKDQLRDELLVYDTGLRAVPLDDPMYPMLVSLKDDIAAKINEPNIRLLRRLPYDVFREIFSKVSVADRVRCAMTCKGWRNKLLNWHDMWTTMDIRYIAASRLPECIAHVDGKHVQEVFLGSKYDKEITKALEALVQNGYNQLRRLGKMPFTF